MIDLLPSYRVPGGCHCFILFRLTTRLRGNGRPIKELSNYAFASGGLAEESIATLACRMILKHLNFLFLYQSVLNWKPTDGYLEGSTMC